MVFLGFLDVFGNFGKITTFGKTTSPSKNTFLDGYMYNIGGYVDIIDALCAILMVILCGY